MNMNIMSMNGYVPKLLWLAELDSVYRMMCLLGMDLQPYTDSSFKIQRDPLIIHYIARLNKICSNRYHHVLLLFNHASAGYMHQ